VAASIRARGPEVNVIAPQDQPMQHVFGPALGSLIRSVHEEHGVVFHLGRSVESLTPNQVRLTDGTVLDADVVVAGIGVRPRDALLHQTGVALDRGVLVNEYLETSVPGVFAAGDLARWPDPHSGERIRVEHWVVAQRQGQTAARNMLGRQERFDAVPFFWTQHYDLTINYVGHAAQWDAIDRQGRVPSRDLTFTYRRGDRVLAVATIGRDRENLLSELSLETSLVGMALHAQP